jgi:hypothetical protein
VTGTGTLEIGRTVYTSVADLRLADPTQEQNVLTSGVVSEGDGGHGEWYWDSASTETDNTGTVVKVTAITTGRFKRLYSGAVNVLWFGAKLDATMTLGGVLSGTDDAAAFQSALDYAGANNISSVTAVGAARFDSGYTIPDGVALWCGMISPNPIYRIGTGWQRLNGSIHYINFGAGGSVDDWASAAAIMKDNSGLSGCAFVYPGQDPTETTTPIVFPPTVVVDPSVDSVDLQELTFVNSYSAIDARRDHALLKVNNIRGYPIKYGIRIGSMTDNDYLEKVHFQPLQAYRGSFNATNSLVGWINQNGIAFDLGRNSWSTFDKVFAFGYNIGMNMYYQAADAGNNINNPGGTESAHITNSGFDSCYYGVYATHGAQAGTTHFGVSVSNTFFAPRDNYNAGRDNSLAVYWDMDASAAGDSSLTISGGCRFHAGREHLIHCINARNILIESNQFYQWGLAAGGYAAIFDGCNGINVNNNALDGQSTVGVKGVLLRNSTINSNINQNNSVEFDDVVVEISATGTQERYNVSNNNFDASGAIDPILDSALDDNSYIGNNTDDKRTINLSNTDVDGSGILQIPREGNFFKYIGTTTPINGVLQQGTGRGPITIRFSNVITVTDNAAGVSTAVLRLAGNFVTSADDVLTLFPDGAAWYESTRSTN